MLRKVKVSAKSFRAYIQHRRPSSEEEVKIMDAITKRLEKNPYDSEAQKQEAEMGLYKNSKGCYIPSEQLIESMVKAGTNIRVKGQGKKTYKDYIKSYIFIEPDEIVINGEWIVDTRYVKIQRSGILRNRPMFKEWNAEFTLIITDDSLPLDTIKEILEIAGTRIGIGDYRPRYGLFTVENFTVK